MYLMKSSFTAGYHLTLFEAFLLERLSCQQVMSIVTRIDVNAPRIMFMQTQKEREQIEYWETSSTMLHYLHRISRPTAFAIYKENFHIINTMMSFFFVCFS